MVSHNQDVFIEKSPRLFDKYYLEINTGTHLGERSLLAPHYVYHSWAQVCTACCYRPNMLSPQYLDLFKQDIHYSEEGLGSALIWYLSGVLDYDEELRWMNFVDTNIRKYWDIIPADQLRWWNYWFRLFPTESATNHPSPQIPSKSFTPPPPDAPETL